MSGNPSTPNGWAGDEHTRIDDNRTNGTGKWLKFAKGLGLKTPQNGQKDCFVHHSAIQSSGFRSLTEGDRVEFDIVQGQKGPAAENVSKLS